jgi:ppGpp synthetase/RelA/SpoT-type nucleotidyltranferase
VHDSTNEVDALKQQQQYTIAIDRERRQIRSPQRHGYASLMVLLRLWLILLRIMNFLTIVKPSLKRTLLSGLLL